MKDFFDKVYLINLKRRPDRLRGVRQEMAKGWPFKEPEVFEALDGKLIPAPSGWTHTAGNYACLQSHCRILERVFMEGHSSVLVLEDDICWEDTFCQDVERFLSDVPDDWELLMLGGGHQEPPIRLKPGLVRCVNTQLTHALGWRNGPMMRDVYRAWMTSTISIDWKLASLMRDYKVYAPEPFLMYQSKSPSDIRA